MAELVAARITGVPLDVAAHLGAVDDPAMGAVASFIGQVRDHDPDVTGTVELLEYEAHPDAESILAQIAVRVAGEREVRIAVSHRVGALSVGDVAVMIAVASAHRADAFAVCRELIETIKTDLPLWKRQIDDEGHAAWKGIGPDQSGADQPPANGGSTSASSA